MDLYILDAISSPPSRIVKTMSLDTDQGIVFFLVEKVGPQKKNRKKKKRRRKSQLLWPLRFVPAAMGSARTPLGPIYEHGS